MNANFSQWLETLTSKKGSDIYITVGCPPVMRGETSFSKLREEAMGKEEIEQIIASISNTEELNEFAETGELNKAIAIENTGRFRVNVFKQKQLPGMVIRKIVTDIPTMEQLGLPAVMSSLVMEKRGLILMVGGTGTGKSTSMAAMLGHRNLKSSGHIITIEDPIEFVHEHKGCIITQREVGIDTASFDAALKNSLRQRPDIIMIGEIRDTTTMEHALKSAETGHLCMATLHANNANQAIERILSFFPKDNREQVLLTLAMSLKAIISQRLVTTTEKSKTAALEILLNQGLIKDLIRQGKVQDIKKVMMENLHTGMQTFDQSLVALWQKGIISKETALSEADNVQDMKISMQQNAPSGEEQGLKSVDTSNLSF